MNKPKVQKDNTWCVYYRIKGCSMRMFHGLTRYNADIRVNALTAMYGDWEGKFVVAK